MRIGISKGLRIPKSILDACGIREHVDLSVEEGRLVIEPVRHGRQGWADAARAMHERGEDQRLDEDTPTEFDATSWNW